MIVESTHSPGTLRTWFAGFLSSCPSASWGALATTVEAPASTDDKALSLEDDAALLEATHQGNDDAFRLLVERHHQRLLHVAERLLGDPVEAQDVVQETFLQAYRKAHLFEPRGEVGAWLYRIAVNGSLKHLRRQRLVRFFSLSRPHREAEGSSPHVLDPMDLGPGAYHNLEAKERWRRTRANMDRLPPSQRTVLILARFEGLTMRQIASVLGISEKAVESRLGRALTQLRRQRLRDDGSSNHQGNINHG